MNAQLFAKRSMMILLTFVTLFSLVAPVEVAINDIWKASLARKQEIYTPARWRWVAAFMRNMPSFY